MVEKRGICAGHTGIFTSVLNAYFTFQIFVDSWLDSTDIRFMFCVWWWLALDSADCMTKGWRPWRPWRHRSHCHMPGVCSWGPNNGLPKPKTALPWAGKLRPTPEDKPCLSPKSGACLAQCWLCCVYVCITLGSSLVFPPQLFQSTKSEDCWLNTMRLYTKICRYMRYMQYYTQCCKKTADPKPLQSAVSCCSSSSAYFLMSTRKHDFSVWPFWRLLAPCHFFPEWMTWSQCNPSVHHWNCSLQQICMSAYVKWSRLFSPQPGLQKFHKLSRNQNAATMQMYTCVRGKRYDAIEMTYRLNTYS